MHRKKEKNINNIQLDSRHYKKMLKKVTFAEPDNTGHNDEIEHIVNRLELFKGEEGAGQTKHKN